MVTDINNLHHITEPSSPLSVDRKNSTKKEPVDMQPGEFLFPLLFLLSLSMVGLRFPLGFLVAPVVMLIMWFRSRYDFLIMFTYFMGGYGLSTLNSFGVHSQWVTMLLGIGGYVMLQKYKLLNKSMLLWVVYAIALVWLSTYSIVSFKIQLPKIVRYLTILYFMVPLLVFAGREFDLRKFWRALMPYMFILCVFYLIDAIVFCGEVLVPRAHGFETSFFYDLNWRPLSFNIWRVYPRGLFIMTLLVIPAARYYSFKTWQWVLIISAILATVTFTFIIAIVAGYVLCQNNRKRLVKWSLIGAVILGALYVVDSFLPVRNVETTLYAKPQSTLRVKSSFDQIFSIFTAKDEQDWAQIGSGRFGQAIPKLILLYQEDKEWTGFGFLDIEENTPAKYIDYNEFNFEEWSEDNWEVANDIEIMALEVFTTIGWIGLTLHILYFVFMWLTVRRCRNVSYFVCEMLLFAWLGVGGFEGLTRAQGLYMVGLTYGIVLLTNRPWQLKAEHKRRKEAESRLAGQGQQTSQQLP